MDDLLFVTVTLALFALAALLVGLLDRRLDQAGDDRR